MISIQTSEGLQTKYPNQVAISVKAGQFASEKILPQIFPIELSLVAS